MVMGDRRRNTRVVFDATVDVKFPDQLFEARATQDLSIKGIHVHGVQGQRVGDQCELALHLAGMTSDLSLRMKGEVVRVEDDGVGVHFTEIDLDSFYHLKNIVYYNSEDPDHIEEHIID